MKINTNLKSKSSFSLDKLDADDIDLDSSFFSTFNVSFDSFGLISLASFSLGSRFLVRFLDGALETQF